MNLLSPRREIGEFKKRYKWMALAVVATFALLVVRLFQLQVVDYRHFEHVARDNITKTIVLPATRGLIRDVKGRVVAHNRPSYNVYITPQLLRPEQDVDHIADLMTLSDAQRKAFSEELAAVPLRRRTHQIEMFTDISRDQLAALETHSSELPGLDVVAVPVRVYPMGRLGAHAVGYLNEVNADDLKAHPEEKYRPGDVIGRTGIERAWESDLRGKSGFRRILVDARGRQQERALDERDATLAMRRDPVPGHDLTLTLDTDLQRAIERAFRGHPSGAAVAVDVNSGRVLGMFSKPAYDLNEMSGHLSGKRFRELTEDPFRPLIDKTVYESYFPGSTFKPISALSAIGDDVLDPLARVECIGYYELGRRRFRCTHAHGEVDMRRALVQSCNVYFYKLAEQVGLDRLARYAREFGLGERSGIGINSESSGTITTKEWYEKLYGKRFRLGFTLNAAIGQGNTRTTLLQLAMAYAAIANGGKLWAPFLVSELRNADGDLLKAFEPDLRRKAKIADDHLSLVREGLVGVVNDPTGTAYESRIAGGVVVAGKTGTAQVARRKPKEGEDPRRAWYRNRDHAWFAGFAPAHDPSVAIVVLVEHGGAGGKTAAPIAIQVLQDYLGSPRQE